MEFRMKKPMRIAGEERSAGSILDLADALPALPHGLYSGSLEAIPHNQEISEDFVLAVKNLRVSGKDYLQGQLVPTEQMNFESISRALNVAKIMHITEEVVFNIEKNKLRCENEDCNALFVSRDAKLQHKKNTGHKRKYKKTTEENEGET